MKMALRAFALLVVAGIISGCEWTGSDDGDSWNSANNWINFSGNYRGEGGYLVSAYSLTSSSSSGSSSSSTPIVGEGQGNTTSGMDLIIAGRLSNRPIMAGSVTIVFGGNVGVFTDSGASGALSGTFKFAGGAATASGSGEVNYQTGEWYIKLSAPGLDAVVPITASYTYTPTASGTSSSSEPGSSGFKIYVFQVSQVGNAITLTDNTGKSYSGKLGNPSFTAKPTSSSSSSSTASGSSSSGSTTTTQEGEVVVSFSVSGVSMAGLDVTIAGTLQGYYDGTKMINRIMRGTWIEKGGKTGDVRGRADAASSTTTT